MVAFFSVNIKLNDSNGSALVVLYSQDLETSLLNVEKAGGIIVRPIFFHFREGDVFISQSRVAMSWLYGRIINKAKLSFKH